MSGPFRSMEIATGYFDGLDDCNQYNSIEADLSEPLVCFGEIVHLPVQTPSDLKAAICKVTPVTLTQEAEIIYSHSISRRGTLRRKDAKAITVLMREGALFIESFLHPNSTWDERSHSICAPAASEAYLSIVIYGPMRLYEGIGQFCQTCSFSLQDPLNATHDLLYRNPHRMSGLDDDAPFTSSLRSSSAVVSQSSEQSMDLQTFEGFMDDLNTSRNLIEEDTPLLLETQLLRHQRQGLSFMIGRELGWDLASPGKDVWSAMTSSVGAQYVNNVTGGVQLEKPPQFSGGILADEMGLGKSLSIISLITYGIDLNDMDVTSTKTIRERNYAVESTLIIVPLPLLATWEAQFERHVRKRSIAIHRHHGTSRISENSYLGIKDVVITTYQTVEYEYRKKMQRGNLTVLHTHWKRIVLDEAHYVREASNNTTKALCSLHATSRWVVTGTPLQNRLSDLTTLFTFLRIYPYDSPRAFNEDIVKVWKAQGMDEAAGRLRRLLRCIMLRRSQTVIKLPRSTTIIREVNFTHEEQLIYNETKIRAREIMGSIFQSPSGMGSQTYFNILQQINDLRMICNMGTRHRKAIGNTSPAHESPEIWNSASAHALITSIAPNMDLFCLACNHLCMGPNFDAIKQVLEFVDETIWMTSCMMVYCSQCVGQSQMHRTGSIITCSHVPLCPLAPINPRYWAVPGLVEPTPYQRILPTKVRVLMEDLQLLPYGTKSIVFTFWKSTLDIIEEGLQSSQMSYLRIDGSMSVQSRESVLNQFRSPAGHNVLTLTISCASVGLDLTVASRVFLMEPHWNPSVEDQALARVHRMGQLNEVVSTRYIIKGSFEENVLKKQQHKKRLAEVLFSQDNQNQKSTAQGQIEELQSYLQ